LRSPLRVAVLATLLLIPACATRQLEPLSYAVPIGARMLGSEPISDEFNCPAGNCVHWYQVSPTRKGELFLFVEIVDLPKAVGEEEPGFFSRFLASLPLIGTKEKTTSPEFEITVKDARGKTVSGASNEGRPERPLQLLVSPGQYLISVRSADEDIERFAYRISERIKYSARARRAPPKPVEPKFEARSAMILEIEGWGVDVEAVLVDLGSNDGAVRGLKGTLIDGGKVVGRLLVGEVFEDGSRAKVEGGLERPLSPDASAKIMVPAK
jgi:hypothetical protein